MRISPYIEFRLINVRSCSYYLAKKQWNVILFLIFFQESLNILTAQIGLEITLLLD